MTSPQEIVDWFQAIDRGGWGDVVSHVQANPDITYALQLIDDGPLGYSALHVAAHDGSDGLVWKLLDAGLPVDHGLFVIPEEELLDCRFHPDFRMLTEEWPITALGAACEGAAMGVMDVLLSHGANPDGFSFVNPNTGVPVNRPLHKSLIYHHEMKDECTLDAVRQVLRWGADPNVPMRQQRWVGTPLVYAWRVCGDPGLCHLLLEHGACLGNEDVTVLRGMIRREDHEIGTASTFRGICGRLPDIDRKYPWGTLLGAFAIYEDCLDADEILPILLENGADPMNVWPHRLWGENDYGMEHCEVAGLSRLLNLMKENGTTRDQAQIVAFYLIGFLPKLGKEVSGVMDQVYG